MSITQENGEVVKFIQQIVEKLTPAVAEAVTRKASGHFEIHFSRGEYTRIIRTDSL